MKRLPTYLFLVLGLVLLLNVNAYAGDFIAIAKKTGDEYVFFKSKGPDKETAINMALEKCYQTFIYVMNEKGKLLSKEKSIKYAKKNKWCYIHEVV